MSLSCFRIRCFKCVEQYPQSFLLPRLMMDECAIHQRVEFVTWLGHFFFWTFLLKFITISPSFHLSRRGSQAQPFSTWWEHYFIYLILYPIFILSSPVCLHQPSTWTCLEFLYPLSYRNDGPAYFLVAAINWISASFSVSVVYILSSWLHWWINSKPSILL